MHLGFTINFYGVIADTIYISDQGHIVFGNAELELTGDPGALATCSYPSSAVLGGGGHVARRRERHNRRGGNLWAGATYTDPVDNAAHPAFGVHWTGVDAYDRYATGHQTRSDTFALYLVNRADLAAGNFDIVFDYGDLGWDEGDGYRGGAYVRGRDIRTGRSGRGPIGNSVGRGIRAD